MRWRLGPLLVFLIVAAAATALEPAGIVYESEDIAQPESAWKLNQRTADHWLLWTEEDDIETKRSGGAVMATPVVAAERATPEEGAPPLHCVVDDLEPGAYRVFVSNPGGRPLGYSLDGETWFPNVGSELDLGVKDLKDGRFELWVDDRYPHPPGAPGPAYFDYIRFVPVPAGAEKVLRLNRWGRYDEWLAEDARGYAVDLNDLELKGFELEGAQGPARAGGPPAAFTYTFDRAGTWYAALDMVDDEDGVEELQVSLNGKPVGYVVADIRGGGRSLFSFLEPLTVKPGDKLTFETRTDVGYYRILGLAFAREPVLAPPPEVEHLTAWSPGRGTVQLAWTTTSAVPSGTVEWGEGDAFDQTVDVGTAALRNHRVTLTGLDPAREYRARVVTEVVGPEGTETRRSEPVAFRAAPPTPGPTQPVTVELTVAEPTDTPRQAWPATIGVPFAEGQLASVDDLRLYAPDGGAQPVQADVFSRWPDGSLKWVTVSFLADSGRGAAAPVYRLEARPSFKGPAPTASAATLTESDAGWRIQRDALAFTVGRERPALFADVAFDRDGDGQLEPEEQVDGEPIGANVKLELADGVFRTLGAAETFEVEANGPVRTVLRWEGPFVDPDGKEGWSYVVRATLWRGQPWMQVNLTAINDQPNPTFQPVSTLALRVPLEQAGAVRGAVEGRPLQPVPDQEGWWVHQDQSSHFALRTPEGTGEGEHALGVATAADDEAQVTVALRDFWQLYPKGFNVRPDGVHVRLLPPLEAGAYSDEKSRERYHVNYAWFRDGRYIVRAGQAIQNDLFVRYAPPAADPAAAAQFAGWVNAPLLPTPSPTYMVGTDVLGSPLFVPEPGKWDSYEAFVAGNFEALAKDRENRDSYGWMHYGDWHGEREFNWGNNEYDLPWSTGVQFLRSGDRAVFDRGLEMARHYSTIDTLHGDFTSGWNGLVWTHSFNHVGTDLGADSELWPPAMRNYLDLYGGNLLGGGIDRQGHVYQGGNWMYAALTGDAWLRDVAERVSSNQAERLTPAFDFTIERAGGWPLNNMVDAYRFSGNPYYLNAARIMIERILDRQDPETGGWLHKAPASEVDGEDVMGGKAFAVGILTNGILRYLEQEPEPRPEVEQMLVRGADWLMNESWNPGKGFRYISRAKKYADTGGRGSSSLLNADVIAYAWQKTGDEKYRDFWFDMMKGVLEGRSSFGKSVAMMTRQTIFGVARMSEMGANSAPVPVSVLHREQVPWMDGRGELRVMSTNPSFEPRTVTLAVTRGAAPAQVSWEIPARGTALSPPLVLASPQPGPVALTLSVPGGEPETRRVELVKLPPEPRQRPGQGVAVVGPADHFTVAAARAVAPDIAVLSRPEDAALAVYAGIMTASDAWSHPAMPLSKVLGADLTTYVRGGGRAALWQLNDSDWPLDTLPFDLYVVDPESTLETIKQPQHPLFTTPNAIDGLTGARLFDALGPVAEPWQVLATDAGGAPAIVEAPLGRGRVLVIQPSLDRYLVDGQAPDTAVSADAARAFMANVLAWLAG